MKRQGADRRAWGQLAGLAALLFLLVAVLSTVPMIRDGQLRISDTFFRLSPSREGRPKVVVVAIDDESLQRYGRWPWSRTVLAKLTNNLAEAGASVVGLDILLSEPQSRAADQALQDALKAIPTVIVDKIASYPEGPQWMEPLPQFSQAAAGVGHAQAPLDADSVCRRYPVRELTLDGSRWAFAVEVARRVDTRATSRFLAAYGLSDQADASVVTAKPILVPIPFQRGAFNTISARVVLDGIDPTAVRGLPVLVGFGTTEIGDRLSTPLHPEFPTPGVEVHAQILDGILSGRTLHGFPLWLNALVLLVTCGLAAAVFRTWRGFAAVGVFAVMAIAVYATGFLTFVLASRIPPAGPMMLAVILAPLLVYTADFVLVERSVTQQLLGLKSWLALRGKETRTREPEDLSWRLSLLEQLQTELGSLYELHSALLESTQDLVAIFDEQGNLLLKNRAFAQAHGLQPNSSFTLEQARAHWVRSEDASTDLNGHSPETEVTLDKELYSVRVLPLPSTNLSPKGGTIVTLTNLRTRVERDRARAESLGFITHELRTPLASIQGFAELMMSYPDSPVCAAAPETIFRESKRLLALISSYLDVLRLDAGAKAVAASRVELPDIVRQVFDILQPLASAAAMRLVLESDESATVTGDAPLISGAVLNLVSNAIKYGQPGGDIRVRCFRDEEEVIISVHNLGKPLEPEEVARLFDPYFRASNAEKSKTGWGLGLAFVKRIAEKHGGSVRAESQPSGTRFEIRLPARMEPAMVKEIQ
ncbi:MAG TPA: CHASE2 domain-containing protein [Terriglobales bacterium]|nr:CHASE2 domain-containing protein [Terriglobales bacterium]